MIKATEASTLLLLSAEKRYTEYYEDEKEILDDIFTKIKNRAENGFNFVEVPLLRGSDEMFFKHLGYGISYAYTYTAEKQYENTVIKW